MSKEPEIESFEPRLNADGVPTVWTIGEPRLHNYLLPRDCPRVTFCAGANTSLKDKTRFLTGSSFVVAIESCWFTRCCATTLYLYEFDPSPFTLVDVTALYYAAKENVRPIAKYTIPNIFDALFEREVEVRLLPSLWHLREEVAGSSLDFSIIRMRNALPPPPGFISAYPVPV